MVMTIGLCFYIATLYVILLVYRYDYLTACPTVVIELSLIRCYGQRWCCCSSLCPTSLMFYLKFHETFFGGKE